MVIFGGVFFIKSQIGERGFDKERIPFGVNLVSTQIKSVSGPSPGPLYSGLSPSFIPNVTLYLIKLMVCKILQYFKGSNFDQVKICWLYNFGLKQVSGLQVTNNTSLTYDKNL